MAEKFPPPTSGDDDKTIIRPMPGGRSRFGTPPQRGEPVGPETRMPPEVMTGSSPLVEIALPLLSMVSQLRNLPVCRNIDDLQNRLNEAIRTFESKSQQRGISSAQTRTASYFLCALIDETVLNTPWGGESDWGHNSLLIQFHKEAWGGEKFFHIVSHLTQQPTRNIALIELAYLCLSLGFEGKYRLEANGLRQTEQLRQELFLIIQRSKDRGEQSLSIQWQGLRNLRNPIVQHLPVWVFALIIGSLLMLIYLGFAYAVNHRSDRVFEQLGVLARQESAIRKTPQPIARPETITRAERFRSLLAEERANSQVEVVDNNLLRILNAFLSGSTQIKASYMPMMEKIALELQKDRSRIVVFGHTDSSPIFSARFPSNWHLSQARARNVANILNGYAPLQDRMSFEGMGATDPIATNDTIEGKARNRRIDIRIR